MQKQKINARSTENGINFYSNALFGGILKTYYDENEQVQFEKRLGMPFNFHIGNPFEISMEVQARNKKIFLASLAVSAVLGIILSVVFKTPVVGFVLLYFAAFAIPETLNLCEIMKISHKKNEKGFCIAKFRCAQFKAINAYNKYQRAPSFEEVEKASSYSANSEILPIIRRIVFATVYSIILLFSVANVFTLLISAAILLILVAVEEKVAFLRFLEFVVLSKPTNKEIKLATEAIKEFLEMEEKLKEERTGFNGIMIHFEDNEDDF